MKRIILFIGTNLAVMLMLSITMAILGVNSSTYTGLLVLSLVIGFSGSLISLFMSKIIAKWTTGARVITQPANDTERWLVGTVQRQAMQAGITMPEVAIYDGEPNAFATGPSKNNSLVAVSTGLLASMNEQEVEAVLAHEVAHVANGDMVTLTLVQGVVNTFVAFIARIVGKAVDGMLRGDDEEGGTGIAYTITVVVCDLVFGILGSMIVMYFSRQREFKADRGAAALLGSPLPMIAALQRLNGLSGELPKSMAASGIAGSGTVMALFATHPSIEERITALQQIR